MSSLRVLFRKMGVKRLSLHSPEDWRLHASVTPGAQRSVPAGPRVSTLSAQRSVSLRTAPPAASLRSPRLWVVPSLWRPRAACVPQEVAFPLGRHRGATAGVSVGGCAAAQHQRLHLTWGLGSKLVQFYCVWYFLVSPHPQSQDSLISKGRKPKRSEPAMSPVWFPSQPVAEPILGKPSTCRECALSLFK